MRIKELIIAVATGLNGLSEPIKHRTKWYESNPKTRDTTMAEEKKIELEQTGIKVKLIGEDGNAFYILGKVRQALRRGGKDKEFIDAFTAKATSGDYYHLLATVMEVVEVE